MRLDGGLASRQADAKCRAFAHDALGVDRAPVDVDELADDRQSDPGAAGGT
jgi:hypothetical protein